MLPALRRLESNHELARSIDGRLWFLRVGIIYLFFDRYSLGVD